MDIIKSIGDGAKSFVDMVEEFHKLGYLWIALVLMIFFFIILMLFGGSAKI